MEAARLSIRNLHKSFSAPVLKNIELSIARGEVRAIVGENGAGKSTLVNILAGNLQKDDGELSVDDIPYEPTRPADSFAAGISCAAQELSIIDTLSVAENIGLRNLPSKRAVIRTDELNRRASHLLERVGLAHISPATPAGKLSLADRQLLELAKALAIDCRLLVLDEPTSALTREQADRLHKIIAEVAADGTAIIYISHRLDDVLQVADTVTILRDGQVVATIATDSISTAGMMEKMTGKIQDADGKPPRGAIVNEPVLELDNVTTSALPNAISLECHRGEIIGIAGLAGSGRSELLEALFGLAQLTGGSVDRRLETGKLPIRNASQAVKAGIGFVGEERQTMGLFAGQSVLTNITLPGLSALASSLGLVNRKREMAVGTDLVNKLSIKCDSVLQDIGQLSGGNQQKALLARWLQRDSEIFLLDEPTRGVDVGTKTAIYDLMFEMQSRGKTILIASSEIEELMAVCDRILVLSDRKLVKTFERGNWSEAEILTAAFQEFRHSDSASGSIQDATARHLNSN